MSGRDLKSIPVLLSEHRHLFGVITLPESTTKDCGFVILNAGLLHNVGPFRLHVRIAEALSSMGFPVIRIDQSGKGESSSRTGGSRLDTIVLDYEDCLRELQRIGVDRTILVGLCSGADDGLVIAAQKDSVAGLILLDGYSRRTWKYPFEHYKKRILSVNSWKNLFRRIVSHGTIRSARTDTEGAGMNIRGWDSHKEMSEHFAAVLARNTKVLAIFTSGQDYYNKHGQFTSCIGYGVASGSVDEVFFADADHTYSVCEHRDRLIEMIANWARQNFSTTA